MKNSLLVQKSFEWLWAEGVRDLCICPGGRNAPFVVALESDKNWNIHSSFDERSAGFFALGLAQKAQRPVALIVTSGTAVAELLPAVMEAFYTRTPLVVISADRPRLLRETGAPQTVNQVNLFGSYVEKCVDMEDEFVSVKWSKTYGIHLNLCFDEPLIDGAVEWKPAAPNGKPESLDILAWTGSQMKPSSQKFLQESWSEFCSKSQRAVFLLSTLLPSERETVKAWLRNWRGWIYAEGPSGLREWDHPGMICSGDRRLQQMLQAGEIDSVIRLGGVPTARAWRNLEKMNLPVFSLSRLPFAGMSRGDAFSLSLEQSLPSLTLPSFSESHFAKACEVDVIKAQKIQQLLEKYPQGEPASFSQLSKMIPSAAQLYIGNSLPIREWDTFADRSTVRPVLANRGANGIDGQLSTACGFLDPKQETWAILGDLTALYDANALWFWQKTKWPLKLVVINNSGGKIFERLFKKDLFYNEHQIQLQNWAQQWGIAYEKVSGDRMLSSLHLPDSVLIEVFPSLEQTQMFWSEYDSLWEK
jgi:2-succinyl-5-enolpyruvyl-6-hydroxy-3-cyclohexene-1-carboxylate synthase